jgi:CubicO group peptidase (beta-lactamase class C family)/enterochelin esterase-like enzyme
MRRLAASIAAGVAAVALLVAGLAGAYSYGRDYYLHRGFATLVQFRRAGTGRLEQVHFYSRALHRNADYLVYLPPHYSPRHRYPVYYLLHGAPGQPRVFVDIANMDVRLDNQLSLGRARPMILVYPDGRIGGSTFSDSEWANTPSGDFESYVIEVVHNVDQRFSTVPRREDRVIGGFSAGAYGAMNIALHHLGVFANVQSWSGYFTQTPTGVFAHADHAALAYNSPLDYVHRLGGALIRDPLRVYMFVGRDDSSAAQQLPMARALLAAGAQVQYRFYPGGHDWSVWYPRLNQLLDLASRDVSRPPARAAGLPLAAAGPPLAARPLPGRTAATRHRHPRSELRLLGALLLALLSAALINLGFVLQHRGHDRARRRSGAGLAGGFRQPSWLLGQVTGWVGFAGQIVAVALAPLTLVQAFSAGSLALSVPLAARLFGHRVTRRQLAVIAVIAASLASLPLGFGPAHGHLRPGPLIAFALVVMLAGGLLSRRRGAAALAVGAGVLYGAADAAVKAESLALRFHGAGILTGWTLLAALCTLGGFVAFQAALRAGDAVRPLSLMNVFTALAAIVLGIVAFGERLGTGPAADALHATAIAAVLACVRPLAGAQQRLLAGAQQRPLDGASGAKEGSAAAPPPIRFDRGAAVSPAALLQRAADSLLAVAALVLCALAALGLLYQLRQLRVLALGPRVADALPLLQLAGFDAQPLARVLAAMLAAGVVLGLALIRLDRRRRVVLVGVFALLVMLIGSDASYALARNLRLGEVLLNRAPGLGPWLEALALAAGSALPGRLAATLRVKLAPRTPRRRALAPVAAGALGALAALVLLAAGGHAGASPSPRPAASTRAAASRAAARTARPAPPRPAAGAAPTAPLPAPAPALDGMLAAALQSARTRSHAPAATAAVIACGRVVWAGASGFVDLRHRRPATDDSLFILNSAAKTIVATMIMQEVQAGRLSLSTRLSRFYPQIPGASAISVRMLLNMTSGLPDYLDNPALAWLISHRPRHHWTVGQILAGVAGPSFEPGSRYQYSDTNYIVLGAILERITRSSIERDLQRMIAAPLGITSATFVRTPAAEAELAHPYVLGRNRSLRSLWIRGFGVSSALWGPVFTDGGLAASSLDLARFANALLGGRLVSSRSLRQMTHLGRGHYGLGIRGRRFDGHFWLGHAGVFGGFAAEDWSDPRRQLTIAAAANLQQIGGGLVSTELWKAIARAYDRHTPATAGCASPLTL